MIDKREMVPVDAAADGVVPAGEVADSSILPEADSEAEARGPDENWIFWRDQISAALKHERRWRDEALDAERLYFGEDHNPGTPGGGAVDKGRNKITDKVALIHANIDVLKPLLFSNTPQPIVRRRFRGDGKTDETDLMAAEAAQRLAEFLIETEDLEETAEACRDDWLIAGRGAGRVSYKAQFEDQPMVDPATGQPMLDEMGQPMIVPVKTSETVTPSHIEWSRLALAPGHTWEHLPWLAFENPMTRGNVRHRFGPEIEEAISFSNQGLIGSAHGIDDSSEDARSFSPDDTDTEKPAVSPFDTVMVWEIWNRETNEVIWWSAAYTEGVLDKTEDPLELEKFWPMPKPLLASVKNRQMTPRPDVKYYERRATEVEQATEKMRVILRAISVSGLFPGQMKEQVQRLLSGENEMIPVESWLQLMEKGGSNNIIQWLPLQHMITALQALQLMREQSKNAMFEASGVSDIMRAQGDPNETATAQQLKGRYAGMRLSERQRRMGQFVRDLIKLMVEVALEHFDTEYIADITGLDLPLTEAERQAMIQQQQMAEAQYQHLSQMHAAYAQAVQQKQMPGPVPPPPEKPKFDRIPSTSWELVHGRLRQDYGRKITVMIETESTILADEQADKEARVEFLSAFSKFVAELAPLAGSGQFDFKTTKELLLFGVRGFPKSRTLEGMIASLPDEPQGEPPEDTQVTVTKIKGEIDKMLKEMELKDRAAERQHEMKMKGVGLIADAAKGSAAAAGRPAPSPQPAAR